MFIHVEVDLDASALYTFVTDIETFKTEKLPIALLGTSETMDSSGQLSIGCPHYQELWKKILPLPFQINTVFQQIDI